MAKEARSVIPSERIERCILALRGQKVMLDRDLAQLYGVKPIALRQQVKRNRKRFPDDFMFQLTAKEAEALVSQNVIPSRRSFGGSLPYAFTEQGVAMLSSVLRSDRAVEVNIEIMCAFVRLRQLIAGHAELARKLDALEGKYAEHDKQLVLVLEAIRQLMAPLPAPGKSGRIGFVTPGPKDEARR
ncbi:MAG: ORF6N domain-containing protein [Gemmataceae bacterium]|nr:ORF6N domain-containing protein [Gemmataceae bacterium]